MKNQNENNLQIKTFVSKVLIISLLVLTIIHFNNVVNYLTFLIELITPFIIGFVVVYIWSLIVNPMETFIVNKLSPNLKKFKRPISIIVSLLIFSLIVLFIFYLVIPQLFESFKVLTDSIPKLGLQFRDFFLEKTKNIDWTNNFREQIQNLNINWQEIFKKVFNVLEAGIGGILGSTFVILGGFTNILLSILQTVIFAIYLILQKEKIGENLNRIFKAYIPENKRKKLYYVLNIADDSFSSFIKGQILDAFIIGLLLYITLLIFNMPYALSISVVIMVTALIPIVGAFIGGVVGFIMISSISIKQAFIFVILLLIVQQLEGNLIYPKIVGDSVGLPGIWVFVAVMIGGAIFGTLGMLIAVPLSATIYKLIKNDVNNRVSKNDRCELPEDYRKNI